MEVKPKCWFFFSAHFNQTQRNIPMLLTHMDKLKDSKEPLSQNKLKTTKSPIYDTLTEYQNSNCASSKDLWKKEKRDRTMSMAPQISNYIPILRIQTKHHDEDSYFSGEERKSIDAFCSEKDMPTLTPKPNSCSSDNRRSNKELRKQNFSENEASTQLGTPQKGQSIEMEEEPWASKVNMSAERNPDSPVPQQIKNYNYVLCTEFSFGTSRCKCTPDSQSADWGRFWKYLSPEEQLRILRTYFDDSNQSHELEFAISTDWWKRWWDFVNVEFEEFVVNDNTPTSKVRMGGHLMHPPLIGGITEANKGTFGDDDHMVEPPSSTIVDDSSSVMSRKSSLGKLCFDSILGTISYVNYSPIFFHEHQRFLWKTRKNNKCKYCRAFRLRLFLS